MYTADVLIAGAGPAGTAAALACARMGADTLLVEKESIPGGMATGGMINVFCGYASGGVYDEVSRAVTRPDKDGRPCYEPEEMLDFLTRALREAGVRTLLDARLCGVTVRNGSLERVSIATRRGAVEATAKLFIDATGDGEIAYECGVPFEMGDETDGSMQPMTMMVKLDNVQSDEHVTFGLREDLQAKMRAWAAEKKLPGAAGHVILIPGPREGEVVLNMTNVTGVDATDPEQYTRAQLICREQVPSIVAFLKENVDGYANCRVARTAAYAGIRESRRFEGEARVEAEDVIGERVFPDWCVAGIRHQINIHNTSGSGSDRKADHRPHEYTIPFGALLPKGVNNLLLAGRSISGSHRAHGSYRVMPICMAMGEAAGTAAALCAKDDLLPRALDIHALQRALVTGGVKPPAGWTE